MARVSGALGFSEPLAGVRFKFHSNDTTLDVMNITQREVPISDKTVAEWNAQLTMPDGRRIRRAVQLNVWRVLTPPPQDVPLAVCDARSLPLGDRSCCRCGRLTTLTAVGGSCARSMASLSGSTRARGGGTSYPDMRTDEVLCLQDE